MFTDASSLTITLTCLVAGGIAAIVGMTLTAAIRRVAAARNVVVERRPLWQAPLTLLLVVVAIRVVLSKESPQTKGIDRIEYVLSLAQIAIVAWLLTVAVRMARDALLALHPEAGLEDRGSRHARTKINLLARVTQAFIVAIAVGAMLWTIPELRKIGIGILASASVVAVIVGLAAQTTLGNLFAGIQIAFTDAIRIDDIVVVEGRWGRIEEITLTYVAVRVWDNTTLILPCTYFTTTPFQNWTHNSTTVTGTVEIAVDWVAPLDALRDELGRLLERSRYSDTRQADLFVDDATGHSVRVIAMVTATSGDTIAPLCREVREGLVTFLRVNYPDALPRDRSELLESADTESASAMTHSRSRKDRELRPT